MEHVESVFTTNQATDSSFKNNENFALNLVLLFWWRMNPIFSITHFTLATNFNAFQIYTRRRHIHLCKITCRFSFIISLHQADNTKESTKNNAYRLPKLNRDAVWMKYSCRSNIDEQYPRCKKKLSKRRYTALDRWAIAIISAKDWPE